MKKTLSILLVAILFLSGCRLTTAQQWLESDFSFYDTNGREVFFLTNEDTSKSLSDLNAENGLQCQTKRGVKIGDRANKALTVYDLKGFYYSIYEPFQSKEEVEKFDEEFHKKYPEAKEAILHTKEIFSNPIASDSLELFLSAFFYVEGGKLKKYDLDSNGNIINWLQNTETYYINFVIKDEKISDIFIEKPEVYNR